jgi:hypothetical protein
VGNSDLLFQRNIQIVFGIPGQTAYQYDGLRVTFKIEKNSFSSPNKGKIQVYNLSTKSRGLSEKKGLVFILRAGYGSDPNDSNAPPPVLPEIFKGDIFRSHSELNGSDIVTTFEVGAGLTSYQQSKMDVSFSPGTAIKQAFTQVAQSFGKPISDLSFLSNGTFLNGLTLSGLSRDHMDYLADKQGLEWSIQDDTIQVLPKGTATADAVILLTPETGLLDIPRKKDLGIEFRCMMQPKIRPGRRVRIESKAMTGNFRCNRVILTGDNYGKDFSCDVEATPV